MNVTPDGARYLAPNPPSPFHLRWLIPFVCRDRSRRWLIASRGSLVAVAVFVAVFARSRGLTWQQSAAAGLLVAGLPSVRFLWHNPVLVDAPAMALALASAVEVGQHRYATAVILAVVAGCVSERAPIFAALFAWNPLPLVGLAAVAVIAIIRTPGPDVLDAENAWILAHPVKAARKYHLNQWRNPLVMLTPWGALLLGFRMEPRVLVVLAVAYAQMTVATDAVRLYQWASPGLAVVAVGVLPPAWLPLLIVAHWCNPLAGNGV